MPNRVVSDALWTSHKLKKVPVKYRAEYANLIPLAEINGAFEADPELVWSKVYSFNRNDVTPVIVAEILDEFEKAGMLTRYKQDGKIYGKWVGIDKPGRLPGKAERERYNPANLPPLPIDLQESDKDHNFNYSGSLTIPLDSYIVEQCQETIGHVEDKKFYAKELKAAIKQHGHDKVLGAFKIWLPAVLPFSGRKPINAFIKSLNELTPQVKISSPALQEVETEIALITDNQVFFHVGQKPILASLISQYGKQEVLEAFNEFWSVEPDNMAFAAKNFIEQAQVRIESVRRNKQQKASKERLVDASIQAAREAAEIQEEIEDEL